MAIVAGLTFLPIGFAETRAAPVPEDREVSTREVPYMARVLVNESASSGGEKWRHDCGGTFVSPVRVLTAAHCVIGSAPSESGGSEALVYPPGMFRVAHGSDEMAPSGGEVRAVSDIWFYPGYTRERGSLGEIPDVAILTLDSPVPEAEALPLATAGDAGAYAPGTEGTVSGWPRGGDHLRQVRATVIDRAECDFAMAPEGAPQPPTGSTSGSGSRGQARPEKYFCARAAVRPGDSGSAFVWQDKVIGIMSQGKSMDGTEQRLAAFTNTLAISAELASHIS
ncbi:S1 family peptidase [Nocardia inohanensis]|uniref:S1 family peptidase n=1 Tax=Nocardia inohanensis TaxID=209246 RepID=UPI00083247C5|nr:trypsin-like serine protease [Nocardia inohanensis]